MFLSTGIEEQAFLQTAKTAELQQDCIEVIKRCAKQNIKMHVLSVNWSEKWICQSLKEQSSRLEYENPRFYFCVMRFCRSYFKQDDPMLCAYANELEYNMGVSTGRLLRYETFRQSLQTTR